MLIRDNFSLKHGVKIRTPEFRRPEDDEVLQSKSRLMARRFCELLNERADIFQRSVPEAEPLASAAVEGAGGESGAAEQPAALGTAETDAGATISGPMTLLWERMGDREAVLEEAGLHWPDWVEHDQLHLANGRFPLNIPGLMNLPKKMELKRAAEPKRMARQKAIWEVADALSGKKAYKRPY